MYLPDNFVVVYDKNEFTVRSYCNGWGYEIDSHEHADTLSFQDHEADEIRELTNNFSDMTIVMQMFDALV